MVFIYSYGLYDTSKTYGSYCAFLCVQVILPQFNEQDRCSDHVVNLCRPLAGLLISAWHVYDLLVEEVKFTATNTPNSLTPSHPSKLLLLRSQ